MPLAAALLLAAAGSAAEIRAKIDSDAWREGLEAARAMASAEPASAEARSLLGEALFRAGRIEEAGTTLEPLASTESPPPRGLVALGLVRASQGRTDEAGALLDRALEAAPEDRVVLYHAASVGTSRADTIARLERYLAKSEGDDPDRIEGAKGTIRFLKALGDRKTWIPENAPDRLELPMRAIPDGRGGSSGFVVAVEAGGKKVWSLLDTGSGGFFGVERAFKKSGLDPLSEETVFAGGGKGRDASKKWILPSFALGDLHFRDALLTTTTAEIDPQGRFQAVLGLSVFDGYRVTLDLARGRLVLERSDDSVLEGTPYWNVSGMMLVEAGAGDDARGLFLFDTGATRSVLSHDFAADVEGARAGGKAGVHTYGGAVEEAKTVMGVALSFPGLPPDAKPKTAVDLRQRSRLSGVEVSGYLGLDVLDGARIVVDTVHQRIAAERPSKK